MALYVACDKGHVEVVKKLLHHDANPMYKREEKGNKYMVYHHDGI